MDETKGGNDQQGKSFDEAIMERYLANLPDARAAIKDLDFDQLKEHIAEKDAWMTAFKASVLSLESSVGDLAAKISVLTSMMNGLEKGVNDIPKMITDTVQKAVLTATLPAGRVRPN